ncbi:hypothetical protein ASG25_10005 [Rhizobium sp. Leaf384]|uniref:abscisic acid-deficient protein Aba4 family protein n=1 Tax=unclassified Rhizobium TaxID=2613769 RepID=UPI000715B9A0|nr:MULTISPECIES: abscisic acid-deficient protein Aba4 family protein [unclassified Rhizobium]KQS78929.1 hypothetical protein ASG25_10005 [Rhizobium sp. Leaf384]KQS82566.1 hypothetical protein ASG58_04205 [Rhizobium sp. Leaf383]
MTPDDLFACAGQIALVGWSLLILGPRRFAWLNLLPALVLPAILSALYAVLVLTRFAAGQGGFGSLADVRLLFSDDWLLLAGWIHYLAFDLMIGARIAARLDRVGVGRLLQAFLLPFIFLFGPLGALIAGLAEGMHRTFGAASARIPSLKPLAGEPT